MTIELKILAWSVLLGILQVLIAGALGTQQRGLKWNVGNRDGTSKPLTAAAARAERASRNFLETFPFFAAVALAVVIAKQTTDHTALGAQLYFWARLAYFPIYIIGIAYVRTLVFAVSLWGILQLVEALL
ncbi:MAG: MAPEG family protein [Pseudomonadota bacterium]|nr:MAPEG family protein [Pseudomonadota bacterium]